MLIQQVSLSNLFGSDRVVVPLLSALSKNEVLSHSFATLQGSSYCVSFQRHLDTSGVSAASNRFYAEYLLNIKYWTPNQTEKWLKSFFYLNEYKSSRHKIKICWKRTRWIIWNCVCSKESMRFEWRRKDICQRFRLCSSIPSSRNLIWNLYCCWYPCFQLFIPLRFQLMKSEQIFSIEIDKAIRNSCPMKTFYLKPNFRFVVASNIWNKTE